MYASINMLGSQTCINNPDVNQRGQVSIDSGRQVIVPSTKFYCNGRITNIAVSMEFIPSGSSFSIFQVWCPVSPLSSSYTIIGEVQLPAGDLVGSSSTGYCFASLAVNGNSQIEFQSGDVIGYYQPTDPRFKIWNIQTSGYTSYSNTITSSSTSIDTNSVNSIENDRQPLIEVTFGKNTNIILSHVAS